MKSSARRRSSAASSDREWDGAAKGGADDASFAGFCYVWQIRHAAATRTDKKDECRMNLIAVRRDQ
jgi:hypothetical protein